MTKEIYVDIDKLNILFDKEPRCRYLFFQARQPYEKQIARYAKNNDWSDEDIIGLLVYFRKNRKLELQPESYYRSILNTIKGA